MKKPQTINHKSQKISNDQNSKYQICVWNFGFRNSNLFGICNLPGLRSRSGCFGGVGEFGILRMGFTLVEILISIAVVAIVVIVIVTGLSSFRRSADLNHALDGVVAQIRETRRRTIESKDAARWGVHIVSTSTTLFKGATYSSGAADNEIFVLPPGVTLSGIPDIIFKRISGETDNAGTLTLTQGSDTKAINIYLSGLVEIQ